MFDGTGTASMNAVGNTFQLEFTFKSDDFDASPPTSVEISLCNSNITISDVTVEGGLLGTILTAVAGVLESSIESTINPLICQEADGFLFLMQDLVKNLDAMMEPFEGDIPAELQDPMHPENNLVDPPSGVELFDFQSDEGLFRLIFNTINTIFDETDLPEGEDLAINELLRHVLLDEDGGLVIDGSWLALGGIMFTGQESESSFSVLSVKIFGIDNVAEYQPLNILGKYTLSSSFSWSSLTIETELEVKMSPSDAESFLLVPGDVQNTKVRFDIENLELNFALMAAIKSENVTDMPFSSLTGIGRMLPCLLNHAVYDMEISDMTIKIGDVSTPTPVSGSDISDLDALVSSVVFAFFDMYKGSLITLMPNMAQISFRGAFNEVIDAVLDSNSTNCKYESDMKIVNLPDLLLPPSIALNVGGTGTSPYGTIFPGIFRFLIDRITRVSDGEAVINEMFMKPYTFEQSGTNGTWTFGDLMNVDSQFSMGSFVADVKFKVYDVMVENLDSIGSPFYLLNPSDSHSLSNAATLGVGVNPFIFRLKLMFHIDNGGKCSYYTIQ